MQFKKANAKNLSIVLKAFTDYLSEADIKSKRLVAGKMNKLLDELLEDDFFGTEGQCDPRGDHRD